MPATWNESFIFTIGDFQPLLTIELKDQDRIKPNAAFEIGEDTVDLSPMLNELPVEAEV
jgi:hypothetical protein